MTRILLAVVVCLSVSASSCEQLEQRLLPDPLPYPECPWLGGCDLGDPTVPGVPADDPDCGLGELCLGSM